MDFEMKVSGLEELLKKCSPTILEKPLRQFFRDALSAIERETKTRTPVDTGRLRASINSKIDTRPVPLWGRVETNTFYAPYVEFGTRPHFPPPNALAGWANRHGLGEYTFVICRAIARRGVQGRHMFEKGLETAKSGIEAFAAKAAAEIEARWKS